MWDFLSVVKNESVEWITATKFCSMNDLSHGWGREIYRLPRSATVICNWFVALSASMIKKMVFSLMWFEWKLLHKWYFKVTKVIREYVGLKCARACCFWHKNHWLPNSQINLNLRKITRCCSLRSFQMIHLFNWHQYGLLFRFKIVWNGKCCYSLFDACCYLIIEIHSSRQWMNEETKKNFISQHWLRFHFDIKMNRRKVVGSITHKMFGAYNKKMK